MKVKVVLPWKESSKIWLWEGIVRHSGLPPAIQDLLLGIRRDGGEVELDLSPWPGQEEEILKRIHKAVELFFAPHEVWIRVSPKARTAIHLDPERWSALLREAGLPEWVLQVLEEIKDDDRPLDRPVWVTLDFNVPKRRWQRDEVLRGVQRAFGWLLSPRKTRKGTDEVGDLPAADVLHGGDSLAQEASEGDGPGGNRSRAENSPSPEKENQEPGQEGWEKGRVSGGSGEGEGGRPGGLGGGLVDLTDETLPDPSDDIPPPPLNHPERWLEVREGYIDLLSDFTPPEDLVERLRRAFLKAIWEGWKNGEGGNIVGGPRWDAKRVAIRVAGYLRPIGPESRRLEHGRPAVLVAADTSASMSSVADQALVAAVAAGRAIGRDVVVAATYNGVPFAIWTPETRTWRQIPFPRGIIPAENSPEAIDILRLIVRRFRIRAIIVLGDYQNAWMVRLMAEQVNLVLWADNFRCGVLRASGIPTPQTAAFPPHWLRLAQLWPPHAAGRIRYAYGCRTAEDFVKAIEFMLRGQITSSR